MTQTTQPTQARPTRTDWFLLVLCALSLTTNVLLGVSFLRITAGIVTSPGGPPRQAGPVVGAELPPLDAERLGGDREVLQYAESERPSLIYVFTPSCQWCARNLENLKALTAHAKDGYRLVGLSLDPNVEDYVAQAKLDFPIYINASPEMVSAYGLGPTPLTLVVSPSGKVLKSWTGAYGGATQKEVEATFGLALPGIGLPPSFRQP